MAGFMLHTRHACISGANHLPQANHLPKLIRHSIQVILIVGLYICKKVRTKASKKWGLALHWMQIFFLIPPFSKRHPPFQSAIKNPDMGNILINFNDISWMRHLFCNLLSV